ncbi:hypothetical protein RB195_005732 [Necator americanus]|uniref:Uncharacterized protein n=1 Tax=Necator americanus TaxID=51031 RepID=A0ABR1BPC2_NECAM
MPVVDPHHQRSQAASLPIRNSPHHDVPIGDLGAPSTVMESLDCTERKLLRRLFGYFWPRVCHNEDIYAEIDVVYRQMTCGRYQHLAPPSKVAKKEILTQDFKNLLSHNVVTFLLDEFAMGLEQNKDEKILCFLIRPGCMGT